MTASLPRATVGKELLCRELPSAKNFFAESDRRQRIVKKKQIFAEAVFKKKIGLPRAENQALGKEEDVPRARLSAKRKICREPREPYSRQRVQRAFFYFCLYFQLQQHIFHKYNTSSTSHISQICHPHHIYHKYVIHLNTCPSQSAKFISHKFMSQSANT